MLRRVILIGLGLIVAHAAAAQEMTAPRVAFAPVDWTQAAADTGGELDALNGAADLRFPGIAKCSVPVLLPLDIAGLR